MKLFHLHKFATTDVQHVRFVLGMGEATRILQQCRCGKSRTEDVDGHWPKERFMPKPEAGR